MIACTELVTGYDDYGKIIFLQAEMRASAGDECKCGGVCPQCDRHQAKTTDALPAETENRRARRGLQALLRMLREPHSSNNRDISRAV